MEDISTTLYVVGVIALATAAAVTLYAYKAYSLVIAAAMSVETLALLMIASAMITSIGIEYILIITVVTFGASYLLSKMEFLVLWSCLWVMVLYLIITFLQMFEIIPTEKSTFLILGFGSMGASLAATIYLRKYARVVTASIIANTNLTVAVSLLLLPSMVLSGGTLGSIKFFATITVLICVLGLVGFLYYHFKIDRRLLEGSGRQHSPASQAV